MPGWLAASKKSAERRWSSRFFILVSMDVAATVSGVLADLDRAGLVERRPDPADRRRTIAAIVGAQARLVDEWLDGAASPLARVLDKLSPSEQQAFVKAMDLLG